MKTLTLKNKFQTNVTLLSNDFIDNYMVNANGEFVKVYLFLLRHLDDPCSSLTITTIADCLNNTENDILRAFRYWESQGLLRTERDADGKIICLELLKNAAQNSSADTQAADSTKASGTASAVLQEIRRDAPRKVAEIDQFRAQNLDVYSCDQSHADKHAYHDRRTISIVILTEDQLVRVNGKCFGSVSGAAACQYGNQIVYTEGIRGSEQQGYQNTGLHERQGDCGKCLHRRSAVDGGTLIQTGIDGLQSGHEKQRHVGRGLPDICQDRRCHSALCSQKHICLASDNSHYRKDL